MAFETRTFHMPRLGYEKRVDIYLPQTGPATRSVIFHDGQNMSSDQDASFGRSWRLGAFLEANPRYQDSLIICPWHHPLRLREYSPWPADERGWSSGLLTQENQGGSGLDYLRDLMESVVGPLENEVKFSRAKGKRIMAGASMGAYISLVAGYTWPQDLDAIGALSTAAWFNQGSLETYIAQASGNPGHILLTWGDAEAHGQVPSDYYTSSNGSLLEVLRSKGAVVEASLISQGHHNEADWEAILPRIFALA